jgi:hypothetical protein
VLRLEGEVVKGAFGDRGVNVSIDLRMLSVVSAGESESRKLSASGFLVGVFLCLSFRFPAVSRLGEVDCLTVEPLPLELPEFSWLVIWAESGFGLDGGVGCSWACEPGP